MRALPERVNAGIGPTRPGHGQRSPADTFERSLQIVLDGVAMFLALPAREISSVVTDNQLEPARFSHLAGRDNFAE